MFVWAQAPAMKENQQVEIKSGSAALFLGQNAFGSFKDNKAFTVPPFEVLLFTIIFVCVHGYPLIFKTRTVSRQQDSQVTVLLTSRPAWHHNTSSATPRRSLSAC